MIPVQRRVAMADADPAPAAPPEANPDLASDAALAEGAAALVAALRSGDSDAQADAVYKVEKLVATLVDSIPPQPVYPRTVAALVAAGVGAALLPLIHCASDVGTAAASALDELMYHCDAELRAVIDNLGVEKLLLLLRESNGERQGGWLSNILYNFTRCAEWLQSLSPDNDLVERCMSLPFLSVANAGTTKTVLDFVLALLKRHPSSRRAVVPSRIPLLVGFLSPCFDENTERRFLLAATVCELLEFLQTCDGFDFAVFDEAGVYVACVELLGDLCRMQADVSYARQAQVTRVLMTASQMSPALRQRIRILVFSCPGAFVSLVTGVHQMCVSQAADAGLAVPFLRALCSHPPAEWVLLDPSFAAVGLRLYRPPGDEAPVQAFLKLSDDLDEIWKTPRCIQALAQPLRHQKLAAAASLASLVDLGDDFKQLLASGDRLEIVVDTLVDSATLQISEAFSAPDFSFWREQALCSSLSWIVVATNLDAVQVADDDVAAEPVAKRARTTSAATLRASDVNVQRRDSTVLLIAGRPFYVFGALIETKSAVLADALSSATTLDPIAVALPNEVPEEQQYALFHAAVELAYTGTIASDVTAESLLPLWCLGDHLQMDELCAWCVERLTPVLAEDAALLERTWTAALARPSDALGDACATAWLQFERPKKLADTSAMHLLKRIHDGCAARELVAAQLVRVLRNAVLASLTGDGEAAEDPPEEED